jgi:peroxiredoxin/YHS domain-containing protein
MRYALCLILLLALMPGAAALGETPDPGPEIPDKAPCFVCTFGGAGHGEEKVKGHTLLEGELYLFCSKDCKQRFDEDPVGYLPPAYPMPAHAFSLTTSDGSPATLASYRGQWLLLDFWATWCAPCVKLMPELNRLASERPGLAVLGVSIDEDAKKAVKFAGDRDISYPIAVDDPEDPVWNLYRVKVIPTAFLIDPEGRVVKRWVGAWDHDQVAAVLDSVMAD